MQTVERRSYFPPGHVLEEICGAVDASGAVDHITFVGDGEPTLSTDLGLLIDEAKERTGLPVAVVTNGSLLHDRRVREDLMTADRVLPTLTTADQQVWRRLHRPHGDLGLSIVVRGLEEFSRVYEGELWLEVMLVHGVNDGEGSLFGLLELLQRIDPDRVDVLVPTRPPTEPWVEAPDPDRVLRAVEVLGAGDALVREADGSFSVSEYTSCGKALQAIGSRHPLREEVAEDICGQLGDEGELARMVEDGVLVRVKYRGEVFLLPRHLTKSEGVSYK